VRLARPLQVLAVLSALAAACSGSGRSGCGRHAAARSGAPALSKVSSLPVGPRTGIAPPQGKATALRVLDWAGFRAAVSFSLDDGLDSHVQHYPELHATGVRLTFYLSPLNNPDHPTWIRARKEGHELGNHAAHHCFHDGTKCKWGTFAGNTGEELDLCNRYLTERLGVPEVTTTAAPYGDPGYVEAARSRFFLNRGIKEGRIAPRDATDPFALPAIMGESGAALERAIDAAQAEGSWQIVLTHSIGDEGGYRPLKASELLDAIMHAQGLGDVWVDTVANVGAYWVGQKLVSEAKPVSSDGAVTLRWQLPARFPRGKYLRVTTDGGSLRQGGAPLPWDEHGYFELPLDAGFVTLGP
jgi:peptidoglycan/xylan/chitin deacetylase (PgdA/CDA1 family)